MKRIILTAIPLLLFLTSCERRLNQAFKSTDKDLILKVAEEYEAQKKYPQAISLYEHATKFVVGTDEAPEVAYRSANLNYLDKNYKLAAHQFKNFVLSYPRDTRANEAAYLAAYCYYLDSPDYNLDQTNTYDALKELQAYIDNNPNSDKIQECNKMIDDLMRKLEKKAFENSKTLYKITEYKAAIVSFENILQDYPDTKLKEEIEVYLLRSKTELAVNSIRKLQMDRINDGFKSYEKFIKEYPNSKYLDEVNRLNNRLENAKKSYEEISKTIEDAKLISEEKNKTIDERRDRKKIN